METRISNEISVKVEDGKYYWHLHWYTGNHWEEISQKLYQALITLSH